MGEWNLERFVKVLKSNIIMMILFALAGGSFLYVKNAKMTIPEYSSTTSVVVANTQNYDIEEYYDEDSEQNANSKKYVSLDNDTYKQIILSESVLGKVIESLNLNMSYGELSKRVKVSQSAKSTIIYITATHNNPEVAAVISEKVANTFLDRLYAMYEKNDTRILDKPHVSKVPSNISPKKYAFIGGFIGIAIAILIAIIREILNKNIKNDYDVESRLGIPVLASIGRAKGDDNLVALETSSLYGESFRVLISNMKHLKKETILVTSNTSGEGKSWVSANLAIIYAKSGKKTLLIDSDMRRGRQDKIFAVSNENGLSNLIENEDRIENIDMSSYKQSIIDNLDLITRGSALFDYSRLLFTDVINKIITEAKKEYDFIIVDGTPNALVADDMLLTKYVDSTLIIVKYNNTKVNDIARMKERIERSGGNVMGIVVNEIPSLGKKYENAYYHYSGYLPAEIKKMRK